MYIVSELKIYMQHNPYDELLDVNVRQIRKYKQVQISSTLARQWFLLNNASSTLM